MPEWAVQSASPETPALETFAQRLNNREGFKSSDELMCQWLENTKPYRLKHDHVVIGPLKEDQYSYLLTVTFYVNPDQLSALMIGAIFMKLGRAPTTQRTRTGESIEFIFDIHIHLYQYGLTQ